MRWLPVALLFVACASRSVKPTERVPLQNLGRIADPPAVAAAIEFRKSDPRHAMELLQTTWSEAVKAGDDRLASFALDRAGDVVMDGYPEMDSSLPLLDESAKGMMQPCDLAHAYYAKAYRLMEKSEDRRLLGRFAHDLGWQLERCGVWEAARLMYRLALDHRLATGDAVGVRFSANNLGRIFEGPKRDRLELYLLAVEAAKISKDMQGVRKAETNIARLFYYSPDLRWLEVTDGGFEAEYAEGPPRGEVRKKFLEHLTAAFEAAKAAEESNVVVCEGFGIPDFDCTSWLDGKPEELFPEPPK